MKGTIRSIIGSIIIVLIITGIVAFTGEEEKVANIETMNNTKNRPVMNQEDNQPIDQLDDAMQPPINTNGAPAEALEACEGLEEGDACSFKSDNEEICKYMQDQLTCVPERFN